MKNPELILALWNITVLLIYGMDKLFARQGMRRIRESTLLALAYFLGGMGAMLGMVLFHHKTGKLKFRLLIPLAVVLNMVIVNGVYYFK